MLKISTASSEAEPLYLMCSRKLMTPVVVELDLKAASFRMCVCAPFACSLQRPQFQLI